MYVATSIGKCLKFYYLTKGQRVEKMITYFLI